LFCSIQPRAIKKKFQHLILKSYHLFIQELSLKVQRVNKPPAPFHGSLLYKPFTMAFTNSFFKSKTGIFTIKPSPNQTPPKH